MEYQIGDYVKINKHEFSKFPNYDKLPEVIIGQITGDLDIYNISMDASKVQAKYGYLVIISGEEYHSLNELVILIEPAAILDDDINKKISWDECIFKPKR